jgi:di/tricarboxylate transporter
VLSVGEDSSPFGVGNGHAVDVTLQTELATTSSTFPIIEDQQRTPSFVYDAEQIARPGTLTKPDDDDAKMKRFTIVLTLAIAYASNVGGTATLTGTQTNVLVANVANKYVADEALFDSCCCCWNLTYSLFSRVFTI